MSLELKTRLRNGTKLLGELWRSGGRCENLWGVGCLCLAPTKFCKAKMQWLALATAEVGRDLSAMDGEPHHYTIIELMRASELDATGLTIKADNGITFGLKGTVNLRDAVADPESVKLILKLLEAFPGSRLVKSNA